jgi:[NiFe] hydrogenase diaphorase moiety small subunit
MVDASHHDVLLNYNRCINCELCVRASSEVDLKSVFVMRSQGEERHLTVNSDTGLLADSDLEIDDRALAVCPVGAILPKHRGFKLPLGVREFDIHSFGSKQEDIQGA